MVPKSIKLLPGELKQLIQASLIDVMEAPEFLRACLEEQSDSTRTLLRLREESGLDHTSLARHLGTLASPVSLFELQRVSRRRPTDRSWVCLPRPGERGVTALMEADNGDSSLLLFETAGEWLRWVMEGFDLLPLPAIPLLELPPMPAEAWVVFAAFCDEFLARDPAPGQSRDPMCFTAERLAARLRSSDAAGDSWMSGFRAVTGETNPGPDPDNLEPILWLQSSEGLLGVEEDRKGVARFRLSQRLMWLVRNLALWDRGFWISSPRDPDNSFLVVQANGLWVVRKGTTAEGTVMYKLDGVSGDELSSAFAEWVRSAGRTRLVIAPRPEGVDAPAEEPAEEAASPEVPPVPPPSMPPPIPPVPDSPPEIPDITLAPFDEPLGAPVLEEERADSETPVASRPPASPAARLCSGCGYEERSAEARFCRECGRPLPAAPEPARPASCRNCGQVLTVEMRFCPNCGQAVISAQ